MPVLASPPRTARREAASLLGVGDGHVAKAERVARADPAVFG